MKKYFLPAFAVALALLPLHRYLHLSPYLIRQVWNEPELFLWFVLILFYFFSFFAARFSLRKNIVRVSLALSVILFISAAAALYRVETAELLRWLFLIWLLPFVDYIFLAHGKKTLALIVVSILVIHAQWSITQFIFQRDLGLRTLGESRLSSSLPGIAKFQVGEEKLIRAYGPYPHANIFGGSLAIGLTILLSLFTTYRTKKISPIFIYFFFVLFLGLLLSFSRSAYAALILALLVSMYLVFFFKNAVRPKTSQLLPLFVILLAGILIFSPLIFFRNQDKEDVAVPERIQGFQWGIIIFKDQSLLRGVGPGNYPLSLQNYLNKTGIVYPSWQLAPLHNVPLLFTIEWGVVETILVLAVLMYLFVSTYQPGQVKRLLFLLPLIPLALFDHYLVTQTAPIVWLIVLCFLLWGREKQSAGEE